MNGYKIVSIEGNIGSGKSTLLASLQQHFAENKQVIFLKEPVDEWENIKDEEGLNMIEKFYADQKKWSFSFQMMAYISRLALLKQAIKENPPNTIIITERSIYTDKFVFAKMLFDSGKIDSVNYQIYLRWFDTFIDECEINQVIYVKTDPQICHNRIYKRSRTGEDNIPVSYLDQCDLYHDDMINDNMSISKLILDGNIDIFENKIELLKCIKMIDSMQTSRFIPTIPISF